MSARRCLHRPDADRQRQDAPHGREDAADATVAVQRPAWVLLSEEARVRGFRNALAFRRWCGRRQVALRRDGKMLWVCPADVDAAVGGLPAQSTSPAVTASVEAIKARRTR